MLKKFISFSVTVVMLVLLGVPTMASNINYSDIRLTKSQTGSKYENTPTTNLIVEGKNADAWEVISNNNSSLTFKSLSPILNVTPLGEVTGKTCGSGTIIAAYTNPDGTVATSRLQLIYTHYNETKLIGFEDYAQKTDAQVRSGSYSADSSKLFEEYVNNVGKFYIAELWFYDNMTTTSGGIKTNNNAQGAKKDWYMEVGVDSTTSMDYYYYKDETINQTKNVSKIKRSEGWHQVVVDPTVFNQLNVYLDGEVIYNKAVVTDLTNGSNMFLMRGLQTKANDVMYYDDFNIYKSTDGRPIIYNVKIENAVCSQALKNQDLVVTFDFFAPCRQEAKTEVYWRNTSWSFATAWLACDSKGRAVLPASKQPATVNDVFVRVRGYSDATSTDYNMSLETISDTVTLIKPNSGVKKELTFFGKNGEIDITQASLLGETNVIAKYKILNTQAEVYSGVLIGAVTDENTLKEVKSEEFSVNAQTVSEKVLKFNLNNTLKDAISIYTWDNFNNITPLGSKTTFDYIGIK